jgi:hypothetical protein
MRLRSAMLVSIRHTKPLAQPHPRSTKRHLDSPMQVTLVGSAGTRLHRGAWAPYNADIHEQHRAPERVLAIDLRLSANSGSVGFHQDA